MVTPTSFRSAVPVLPATDLERALAFYRSRLGFAVAFHHGDYAGLERDGVQIHLWHCPDPDLPRTTSCRFLVEGIDLLYTAYDVAGVIHPDGHLSLKPWGAREFTALDRDGNGLTFAEARGMPG